MASHALIFKAMVFEKPYLFIHEDLFAGVVAPTKNCSSPSSCDEILAKISKGGNSIKETNELLDCYLLKCLDFLEIKKSCRDEIYRQAKEEYQKSSVKEQPKFILKDNAEKYLNLFENCWRNQLNKKLPKSEDSIAPQLKTRAAELIKSGNSSVYNWRKENWEKDILPDKRLAISLWFGYDTTVWEIQSDDIRVIGSQLANHRARNIFHALELQLDPHQRRQCKELETLSNLIDEKRYEKAMTYLEALFDSSTPCIYRHYNWLLHQKAILLSTDAYKRWDEALDIYQRLFYATDYVIEEPEIITLMASNFKRKALYDANGDYINHRILSDTEKKSVISLLLRSLEFYKLSYELKQNKSNKTNSATDAFYDAVNIAYLKKIIEAIAGEPFALDLVSYDISNLTPKGWWEGISLIEWKLLGCREEDNEKVLDKIKNECMNIYEVECPTPTQNQLTVVLRQISLFLHFVKKGCSKKLFSEFKDVLKQDLKKLQSDK